MKNEEILVGKKKNNHYLSQCISKNFIVNSNKTFYEYNCSLGGRIKEKNINRLFAARRVWSEKFEDILSYEYENNLAIDLNNLVNLELETPIIPGPDSLTSAQYICKYIDDEEMIARLSKLKLQIILLQQANNNPQHKNDEELLSKFFEIRSTQKENIVLGELNRYGKYPPFILIDGMMFTFIVPPLNPTGNSAGHICFFFPISTTRFLLWGDNRDVEYFCTKYSNVDYLNLSRIEQHQKKCRIASQNKKYLEYLIPKINYFFSGEQNVKIEAIRSQIK